MEEIPIDIIAYVIFPLLDLEALFNTYTLSKRLNMAYRAFIGQNPTMVLNSATIGAIRAKYVAIKRNIGPNYMPIRALMAATCTIRANFGVDNTWPCKSIFVPIINGPYLQSLILKRTGIDSNGLREIIKAAPNLSSLTVKKEPNMAFDFHNGELGGLKYFAYDRVARFQRDVNFGQFSNIGLLKLEGGQFKSDHLKSITNMGQFDLYKVQIDHHYDYPLQLNNFVSLCICSHQLDDNGLLSIIEENKGLHSIRIRCSEAITDQGLIRAFKGRQSLKKIAFGCLYNTTGKSFNALDSCEYINVTILNATIAPGDLLLVLNGRSIPIKALVLHSKINQADIMALLGHPLVKLDKLALKMPDLPYGPILPLMANIRNVKLTHMYHGSRFSDLNTLEYFTGVQKLHVYFGPDIQDDDLRYLSGAIELHLDNARNITNQGITKWLSGVKKLTINKADSVMPGPPFVQDGPFKDCKRIYISSDHDRKIIFAEHFPNAQIRGRVWL
jgi:hypothetical protein